MSATDSRVTEPAKRRPRSKIWATVKALLRARITAGLLTVLPIIITIWLVQIIFRVMRDASQWVVVAFLKTEKGADLLKGYVVDLNTLMADRGGRMPTNEELISLLPRWVDWTIAIVSVLLTIFILYSVGLFTANVVGKRIFELFERLLERVPLVKTIYRSTKQIFATFGGEQAQNYQRVALVPFPNERTWSIGFITSITRDTVTGEDLATVFLATTPNPTTGYVFVLRRSEVIEVNWTIEEAVRTIISGGILAPPAMTLQIPPQRTVPAYSGPAAAPLRSPERGSTA